MSGSQTRAMDRPGELVLRPRRRSFRKEHDGGTLGEGRGQGCSSSLPRKPSTRGCGAASPLTVATGRSTGTPSRSRSTSGGAVRPLTERYDTFVLDCLTLWVSNLLLEDEEAPDAESVILERVTELLDLIGATGGRWILVSNEVGQGIVPASPLGREYRDVLGRVNQLVASRSDKAYLMVAGLALELKSLEGRSSGPGRGSAILDRPR